MAKRKRSSDAWKRHERSVANYFQTTRNVFGRGEFGFTSTDIITKVDDELWEKIYTDVNNPIPKDQRPTHLIIECKYNVGREGPIFKMMRQAQQACGTGQGLDRLLISTWKNTICTYMSDFPRAFTEVFLPMFYGDNNISLDIFKVGIHHNNRRVPSYVKKYLGQVKKDTEECWDRNRDWVPMSFVCLGNSSKDKLLIYDGKQSYKDYRLLVKCQT